LKGIKVKKELAEFKRKVEAKTKRDDKLGLNRFEPKRVDIEELIKGEAIKDKQLDSFIKYCRDNPNQRMFQALRNWIQINIDPKWNWLLVSDGTEREDTFHWSVDNQSKPLTNLNG
jgi:hypothetical protein